MLLCYFFFFFNDTATTEIYTLSLHDALPILRATNSPDRSRSCSRAYPRSRSRFSPALMSPPSPRPPIPESYVVPGWRLVAGEYPAYAPWTGGGDTDAKLAGFLDAGVD